jgi:branched-chain amino acid transport system ATP-binding protein
MSLMPTWENPSMTKFLDIQNINAAYGDIQTLWDVSLHVNEGEIVGLIGPNGAGKTTLMRLISGLHKPMSGSVRLADAPLHTLPAYEIVEHGVILVPEGRRLFGGMTVLDNLELGAYSSRAREERFKTMKRVFELFPILSERQKQHANTMSGGQQQMLAIGRAIMGLPKLLMLDEPSLGLAPLIVENIFEIIKLMNEQGVTIFLVEQNARKALELADRAYILEQGRIVGTGAGSELLHNDEVRQAYLGFAPAAGK